MTLIVEDGSIVQGANTYVTDADLTTYATARGITLTAPVLDVLLIQAMDYIESQTFKGTKVIETQPLQWPRFNVWIDTYAFPSNQIPDLLKNAQMQAAISIDQGTDPLSNIDRLESSVTVGPISVSYEKGGNAATLTRKITAQLKKLLASNGTSFQVGRDFT